MLSVSVNAKHGDAQLKRIIRDTEVVLAIALPEIVGARSKNKMDLHSPFNLLTSSCDAEFLLLIGRKEKWKGAAALHFFRS